MVYPYENLNISKNPGFGRLESVPFQNLDNNEKRKLLEKIKDELLPDSFMTKLQAKTEKTANLPYDITRGIAGDPNFNFFNLLEISKIPYYLGGIVLALCYKFGGKKALPKTKQVGAGVALYYLLSSAAEKLINIPLRIFRGIDLDTYYKKTFLIKTTTPIENKPGEPPLCARDTSENHKVFESMEFTRWDLLMNKSSKLNEVKTKYNELAKNLGIKKTLNDPNSVVKFYLSKINVRANAWKYMLKIPLLMTAIGLSMQDSWKNFGVGLQNDLKMTMGSGSTLSNSLKIQNTIKTLSNHFIKPLTQSIQDFWKGKGINGISRYFGKFTIISSLLGIALANLNILRTVPPKDKEFVDLRAFPMKKEDFSSLQPNYNWLNKERGKKNG